MIEGVVARISGPVVMAQHMRGSKMYDVVKVGDEICMFRHEKKFFNPNVFAVAIKASEAGVKAARAGWSSLWLPAGAWFGIAVIYFLAAKIRTFGQYTVGDILEVRYGKFARLFGAVA
jgi:hypothetical protein